MNIVLERMVTQRFMVTFNEVKQNYKTATEILCGLANLKLISLVKRTSGDLFLTWIYVNLSLDT